MIRDCLSSIGKAVTGEFDAGDGSLQHLNCVEKLGRTHRLGLVGPRINRDRRPWTGCSDSCENDDGGRQALRMRGVDSMLAIVEQEQQVLVAHSDDNGWERVVRSKLQL